MESEDVIELSTDEVSDDGKEIQGTEGDGETFEGQAEDEGTGDKLLFKMDSEKGADCVKFALPDGSESNAQSGADCNRRVLGDGSELTLDTAVLETKIEVELSGVGAKRPRVSYSSQQPSVHVTYSFLTRESKKKLAELMQQWSEWHARNALTNTESLEASLESGEETYFPALHVGLKQRSTVAFWMDNQARLEQKKENSLDNDSVPLYDRGFSLASISLERSATLEIGVEAPDDSRCFNCGSYSHSFKECPKPRDSVAVNNARMKHNSKRKSTLGPRLPSRYYQNSPGGKFEGIKPGILGPEARQCLGIGEHDPPPWLNRMREIGYPPGYLDTDSEDKPSGITIYMDEKSEEACEDGEILETDSSFSQECKKMTVEFPGINAPIPENAHSRCWAASPTEPQSADSGRNHSYPRSSYSQSNQLFEHRRSGDYLDETPEGTTGHYSSKKHAFNPSYLSESDSPRDHTMTPRNTNLTRSYSERRWNSPHDNLHGRNHSSFKGPSRNDVLPYYAHGSQSYLSTNSSSVSSRNYSSTGADNWDLDDRNRRREAYADNDSSWHRDRHDHHHHHRR